MNERLIENINDLPTLNSTLLEVQKLKDKDEVGAKAISQIIEKDPMETINILKLANSPCYNNGKEIKSIQQAITFFGITRTFAILLDNNAKKLLKMDMKPYNITPEEFANISILQAALTKKWFDLQGYTESETMFLATFVQEIGKVIIADLILEDEEENNFSFDVQTTFNLEELEHAYLGFSTIDVTIEILKKWNIDTNVIRILLASKNPKKAHAEDKQLAGALNVIRTILTVNKPLTEQSINIGMKKAEMYGLNTEALKQAIEYIKTNRNK